MSLEAVGAVASHPSLTMQERALAYELANCANAETGKCHPSIAYLAERLDCTERTIIRVMHKLQERGAIEIKHHYIDGRQTTNSYIFRYYSGTKVSPRTDISDTPEGDISDTPEGDTSVIQNQEEESVITNMGVSQRKKRSKWKLPEGVNPDAWKDFEEYRKEIGIKLTDRAKTLNANRMRNLPFDQQQEMVDRCIASGWKAVYAPQNKKQASAFQIAPGDL